MVFFSLFRAAFSSIFYGIIVTAVVMALLYVLLKSISQGIVRTPVFYVTGVVLAVLLLIQTSLLIGAVQAKDAAGAAEIYVTQLLEDSSGLVSAQGSQQVMDAVVEEFPVIGSFVDIANFAGNDVMDLATTMHATINEYLDSYIWHRVWWALGIIAVACVVVMLFERPHGSQTAIRSSANHNVRRHTRASSRQRIHRR